MVNAGFEPGSVTAALVASDMSLLKHTGALSVQLYPGGQVEPADTAAEDAMPEDTTDQTPPEETP